MTIMISIMKSIKLTTEQKIDLEALHDASRDGRVRDRIKAVLLRSEGWSTSMIAQALRLHETSIVRHIDDYVSKNKLAPENGVPHKFDEEKQADFIKKYTELKSEVA